MSEATTENSYEGQWQYKLASANDQNSFVVVCNALGAKRWEMISLFQVHGMFHGYFKRPAFDNPEVHHLVEDHTSGLDGVVDLPRLPDADRRDERGLPIPVVRDEPA